MRLALIFALWATAASGQSVCADRGELVDSLATRYSEAFIGGGLQSAQQIVEVWVSEEKGTWTVLMTRADGKSCIMASGTNWRSFPPEPLGEDG